MAAVSVSHEAHIIGLSSSLFSECLPTDDSFRIPQRTGMSILNSGKRMGGASRVVIRRVTHALRLNTEINFQGQTCNNSPRKPKLPTAQRRDVREEGWRRNAMSWTATLIVGVETRKTALSLLIRAAPLSQFAFSNPSPSPPVPFFPSNQHPPPEPYSRSLMVSVFSVQIPSALTHLLLPLFRVLIIIQYPALPYYHLRLLYTRNDERGD